MLVLSRKKLEEIVIGGNIVISIVEIRGDKCRVGVSAPSDVSVHRREIQNIIDKQTKEAATKAV
jgi:carbon storage regulator